MNMDVLNSNDKNPTCFKVDYNNNQIEVSYGSRGHASDTSLFPVIIDDDDDDPDDDINEEDDELIRNRYQRKENKNSKGKEGDEEIQKKNKAKEQEEEEDDEMFKSLRRLSTAYDALTSPSHNGKQVRFSLSNRKMSVYPLLPDVKRELTSLINEIYFTNGKASIELVQRTNKLQTKFFSRKKLSTKSVRCVGTSLKNCVQSDVISIDIDHKSTLLPMMCKLMIIVQGAVIERGLPVLVRDFAVQVNLSSSKNNTGILNDNNTDEMMMQQQHDSTTATDDDNETEEDTYESNFINESKAVASSSSSTSRYCKLTRFSKTKKYSNKNNISGRRDSYYRRQSYFNLNEYTSIPYYQYINMNSSLNRNKIDAVTMTEDFYLTTDNNIMIINSSKDRVVHIPIEHDRVRAATATEDDEVEINIPIKVERNNNGLEVSQGLYKFQTNQNRRRTVYEETYNKFEAEVTRYNTISSRGGFRFSGASNYNPGTILTFYESENPNSNPNINTNRPIIKIEGARSVTEVFLGKLVDGNLKQ